MSAVHFSVYDQIDKWDSVYMWHQDLANDETNQNSIFHAVGPLNSSPGTI